MITVLAKLGTFFNSNAGALAVKVLKSLGIGVLSFAVINTTFQLILSAAMTDYGSIQSDALQLINLAGIGEGLGMIASALTFKISFVAGSKLGVLPK